MINGPIKTTLWLSFAATMCVLLCLAAVKKQSPQRIAAHPINALFLQRQSKSDLQRSLSAEELSQKLTSLFEAARWAPSSFNSQPWRYIYALYGTPEWESLFELLVPFNQEWVSHAGALILVFSKNNFEKSDKFSRTHSFDTGLATAQLLLQAADMGLVAHPMSGFAYEDAAKKFGLESEYTVEAMIAVGEAADQAHSRSEQAERDIKPTSRKTIAEFAFKGRLKN